MTFTVKEYIFPDIYIKSIKLSRHDSRTDGMFLTDCMLEFLLKKSIEPSKNVININGTQVVIYKRS